MNCKQRESRHLISPNYCYALKIFHLPFCYFGSPVYFLPSELRTSIEPAQPSSRRLRDPRPARPQLVITPPFSLPGAAFNDAPPPVFCLPFWSLEKPRLRRGDHRASLGTQQPGNEGP